MRRHSKSILIFTLFLLSIPLVWWVWIREMMWTVAAYHVLDVPLTMVRWFSFFFWASWSVPALWLTSFAFLIIELVRRKRPAALLAYALLPFAGAAIFWIGWQTFLIYFGHTKA